MKDTLIQINRKLLKEMHPDLLLAYNMGFFSTKSRALVFILLLQKGKITSRELQDDYGFKEATIYHILKQMVNEGLLKIGPEVPRVHPAGGPNPHYYLLAGEAENDLW